MVDRPEPLIHGERIWLRPSERADIPTFVRWFNDAGTTRYLLARAPMGLAAVGGPAPASRQIEQTFSWGDVRRSARAGHANTMV